MVRIIERLLNEDIDAVRKQYSYVPAEDFDKIIRLDPTFKEDRDSVGKYGKWLLGLYKKLNGKYPTDVKTILSKYDQYKNDRTKDIERDINRFSDVQELTDAVDNANEATLSKKQAQRQAKKDKPYDIVFDGETFSIFVPKNQKGDMVLASFGGSEKAGWCTAYDGESGERYYDDYLRNGGKYYVLINKEDFDDKYQFHFETNQFMDAYDDGIDMYEFGEENPDVVEFFESEGYDWDEYAEEVPDDDEGQIDMITEYLDSYGHNFTEVVSPYVLFDAMDRKNFMEDYMAGEEEFFCHCDADEQFDRLSDVDLYIGDGYTEDPETGDSFTYFSDFDDCEQALRVLNVEDFNDWANQWSLEQYHGMGARDVFADFYGSPERDPGAVMDFVNSFGLDAEDVAEEIVYGQGEGYEWCEDIVHNRR